MCKEKPHCEHPEKKVKHPKECPPEQIAECHPESKTHPCADQTRDYKNTSIAGQFLLKCV